MGPPMLGPKGRTDGVGQYKTPGMRDSIRAQRGRARSALFYRVVNNRKEPWNMMLLQMLKTIQYGSGLQVCDIYEKIVDTITKHTYCV